MRVLRGMRAGALLLLFHVVVGCGDVAGPQAAQITAVVVDGTFYHPVGLLDPGVRPIGQAYARVLRLVDCSGGQWLDDRTHVSDACPLDEGDSNFLAAGTVIYRLTDADPEEALAVYREYDVQPAIESEWLELAPVRDRSGCAVTTAGRVCGLE